MSGPVPGGASPARPAGEPRRFDPRALSTLAGNDGRRASQFLDRDGGAAGERRAACERRRKRRVLCPVNHPDLDLTNALTKQDTATAADSE